MPKIFSILFCLFQLNLILAQDSLRTMRAVRCTMQPKIDGELADEVWKQAELQSDFFIYEPAWGLKPKDQTEVRILYDNQAIYLSAHMFDSNPDSINHELGARGDAVNADFFSVSFDTYNNRQDAFTFLVFASGVQQDFKSNDAGYEAVWESAAKIDGNGWSVEMKIPFSAIRFPETSIQQWGVNFRREVFRRKEHQQWSLIPRGVSNVLQKIGILDGIENIKAPVRLSLTPYVSGIVARIPTYKSNGTLDEHAITYAYGAGADVKYGIDDRFTLDLTLLPDFSQVQSDNKVKNLGPFEVRYDENRFFFKESADLFSKGTIFYSRRIGKTPGGYYTIEDSLKAGETLEKNPSQVKLINAAKVSGRTNKGLGIGIINAVTRNEYATIRDSSGKERKVLTEPFANYNMLVFDQQFKNNSSFYFSNANTMRKGKYDDSNVSAAGCVITNKRNNYEFTARGGLSQHFSLSNDTLPMKTNSLGYKYHVGFEKISGSFLFLLERNVISDTYDPSDLGIQTNYDFENNAAVIAYNFLVPKGIYRYWNTSLRYDHSQSYRTKKNTESYFNLTSEMLLKSLWQVNFYGGFTPNENHNYYESRIDGVDYIKPRDFYTSLAVSTNSTRKFITKLDIYYANYIDALVNNPQYETNLNLDYRQSDHLSFSYNFIHLYHQADLGWCTFDELGNPVFGNRKRRTYTNLLTIRYILKLNMSVDVRVRHYWDRAQYKDYYSLGEDGRINLNPDYHEYNNFNYNVFNVDLVYNWFFAPGSNLSLVYKNNIENESDYVYSNYRNNFSNTLNAPQTNSISLKLLYFIDYLSLQKERKKKVD